MPFTPTHVAAVVPIARFAPRLPFSALAVGSMIPDLHLFLPEWIPITFRLTHTVPGLVAGCLPLGMLMFLWFQVFAKEPLVHLLPDAARQRLHPYGRPTIETSYSFFSCVCLAIVIGAATHLFWDSFTHEGRWGTGASERPISS